MSRISQGASGTSDQTVFLALDAIAKNKQAIVFANTKSSAEKTAEEIAKKIKESYFTELAEAALHSLSTPTKQCQRLAKCLEKGVAFHHAGLTPKQKELIESAFRNRQIKIIAATPTLAAGLDLPAFRVILKDLRRFGMHGLQYIPVIEYLQMAGRAGRPKFDSSGEAIIVASSEQQKEDIEERYIRGSPEAIYSKLAVEPVLRTYVLSLIASGMVSTKRDLYSFFSRTFWAHQFGDMHQLEAIIDSMLSLLSDWEFILSPQSGDFVSASTLAQERFRTTPLGKRVSELYIDPYTANYLVTMMQSSSTPELFALLHVISSTLEMRPLLRVRSRDMEMISDALVRHGDSLIDKEPSIYEENYSDFQDAVKTACFFHDWTDEKDEEYLLETYAIRPGEIRVKLDLADWILYCMDEMSKIIVYEHTSEIRKARLRLSYGIREELLPLVRLRNIGRVRARKLFRNGMRDLGDLRKADLTSLSQLLGRTVALDVKEQLGETVAEVKPRKRKGQINLSDYGEE